MDNSGFRYPSVADEYDRIFRERALSLIPDLKMMLDSDDKHTFRWYDWECHKAEDTEDNHDDPHGLKVIANIRVDNSINIVRRLLVFWFFDIVHKLGGASKADEYLMLGNSLYLVTEGCSSLKSPEFDFDPYLYTLKEEGKDGKIISAMGFHNAYEVCDYLDENYPVIGSKIENDKECSDKDDDAGCSDKDVCADAPCEVASDGCPRILDGNAGVFLEEFRKAMRWYIPDSEFLMKDFMENKDKLERIRGYADFWIDGKYDHDAIVGLAENCAYRMATSFRHDLIRKCVSNFSSQDDVSFRIGFGVWLSMAENVRMVCDSFAFPDDDEEKKSKSLVYQSKYWVNDEMEDNVMGSHWNGFDNVNEIIDYVDRRYPISKKG